MSVTTMKKLTVFAPTSEADALLHRLVKLRCVQLEQTPLGLHETALRRVDTAEAERTEAEQACAGTAQAISVLSRFDSRKKKIFEPLLPMQAEAFARDGAMDSAGKAVDHVLELSSELSGIRTDRARIGTQLQALSPWKNYDYSLEVTQTPSTELWLGTLPTGTNVGALVQELEPLAAFPEVVSEEKTAMMLSVVLHKASAEQVNRVLAGVGFARVTFPELTGTAAECCDALEKQLAALDAREAEVRQELTQLTPCLDDIKRLSDVQNTQLTVVKSEGELAATASTVMLTGWTPAREQPRVEKLLAAQDCAYEISDPEAGDDVPVLLRNNRFAENFEWVLGMYSYPQYGKFDPTFIMSIFYFIIFGLMFADVGYGLLLVLACFGAVKIFPVRPGMKRFLLMFGYCGISCMVCGVLFGSYFGNFPLSFMQNMLGIPPEELPNLALIPSAEANVAVLFDPLQNPMGFLLVSLGIGAVHLIAGMAVKLVLMCREGKVFDGVCDIVPYWILFAGLGLLALSPAVGKYVALAGVLAIVLTQGRKNRNIFMRFVGGLLGLYNLIGYASDLLSYSRILALGLAAGVIAQVVNILATIQGPSVVGLIVMVAVFCFGHVLNLAINVLGTFVHTSRLQYIEFFGKFYEDGGTPFRPLEPAGQYTQEASCDPSPVQTEPKA